MARKANDAVRKPRAKKKAQVFTVVCVPVRTHSTSADSSLGLKKNAMTVVDDFEVIGIASATPMYIEDFGRALAMAALRARQGGIVAALPMRKTRKARKKR